MIRKLADTYGLTMKSIRVNWKVILNWLLMQHWVRGMSKHTAATLTSRD